VASVFGRLCQGVFEEVKTYWCCNHSKDKDLVRRRFLKKKQILRKVTWQDRRRFLAR
jgi:hypothetical protein